MFLVQGVVGTTWDFSVDGEVVGEGVEAKEILGGLDLDPGRHEVSATADDGTEVEAMVGVRPGESLDVVLHLPVDAKRPAVLTSFVNNRAPVPDGSTRLSIAHTAAVGPADIRVDGKVLFSDVASGEELTVVVPADTYRVAVVPSATDDPPVLGPVDLPVPAGQGGAGLRGRRGGAGDDGRDRARDAGAGDGIGRGAVRRARGHRWTARQRLGGWSTALTGGGVAALVLSVLLVAAGRRRRAVLDEA